MLTTRRAVIRALGVAPVIVYGYSMGGAIAQLIAHNHPDVVSGLVLSGTAQHWQEDELRRSWKAMPLVGFGLSMAPNRGWRAALKRKGMRPGARMAWVHSEMTRHSARDIAEAGRELGRFDSRPWLRPFGFPTAVVLTTEDDAVPPCETARTGGGHPGHGVRSARPAPRSRRDGRRGLGESLQPGVAGGT